MSVRGLLVVTVLVAASPLLALPAYAQREHGRYPDERELAADALSLARICASECGLSCDYAECAAIAEVIATRADMRRMRWSTMARAYSSRVFDVSRTDGRRWIAGLRADGGQPHNWPSSVRIAGRDVAHAPWASFRRRWEGLLQAAGAILRGDIGSPCVYPVEHWGARSGGDWERATRAGWIQVNCGLTRNAFWRVPRE